MIVSNRIAKARLLSLAKFLRKLPPRKFNYGHWVGDDWKGRQDLSCGTTACALGWAATMPQFRKLGVRLGQDEWEGFVYRLRNKDKCEYGVFPLFGLTDDEGTYLFVSRAGLPLGTTWSDATPKQVAKKIEDFVAAKYGNKPFDFYAWEPQVM